MEAGFGILGVGLIMLYGLFVLGYLGISIWCIVLFIRLALRGIKALDIYNNKNSNPTPVEVMEVE